MDMKGLDINGISAMMLPYLNDYFSGSIVEIVNDSVFVESYSLHYNEIAWMLPEDKHYSTLNKDGYYNGASGFVYFTYKAKEIDGLDYTALLLSNEDYSKALLLCLQIEDAVSGGVNVVVVKDFLADDERSIEYA